MTMTYEIGTAPITQLDEAAETIRNDALEQTRNRLAPYERGLELETLLQRPSFVEQFKHQMALSVAQVIAAHDPQVQAIYIYDPELAQESEIEAERLPEPTIHLLVLVRAPSAALNAFTQALDRALTAGLKALPTAWLVERDSVLDVNLVTERDVRQGAGLARWLTAVFTPPVKIWSRNNEPV